jgi:hypothetical protein
MTAEPTPTAEDLRVAFEAPEPLTLGLEEELMLLDPESLDLLPRAAEVVDAAGDERVKLEMPASQLELTLPPARTVPEAIAALAAGRRDLAAAAAPVGRLAAAGVHPFAEPLGRLNQGERYALTEREYGSIARRQLVCALQVHVAIGGADRSLAVYNGLRAWLPLVAAVAGAVLALRHDWHGGSVLTLHNLADEPVDVTVETTPAHRNQVETLLGTPSYHEVDDDVVRLTIRVTHRSAFRHRVYELGPRVRVLGPESIRSELLTELESLLD